MTICDSSTSIPYNVFERRVKGKEEFFFYIASPIERGQTIELCFLPFSPPVTSGCENEHCLREWLEVEISLLAPKDLRILLDFLNDDIGSVVYADIHKQFGNTMSKSERPQLDLEALAELVIARRRMHWLALRINSSLQAGLKRNGGGGTTFLPGVAHAPLWTNTVVAQLRKHANWPKELSSLLVEECKKEIATEFRSNAFGDFWTSEDIWCPLAKGLLEETTRLFSNFNALLQTYSSDEKLVDDVCSIISGAVSQLRKISDGNTELVSLAELALTYKASQSHFSNMLPSKESIQTLLNQDYLEAMALCSEQPYQPLGEDMACIATVRGDQEKVSTSNLPIFCRLQQASLSKGKIDVLWYVQTQIVAVVECAALSGIAHLAAAGPSKLSDIREKIRDTAMEALDGVPVPSFSLESNGRQRDETVAVPDPILRPAFKARIMPDSTPIFLSIMWPLLKDCKWKLEAGASPSSVSYLPPGRKKDTKKIRLLKREAALQRGKYARKTTELGLGYIPKQAKRMFVNCAAFEEDAPATTENAVTVTEALRAFEESFRNKVSPPTLDQIRMIVEHVRSLFESLAPTFLYEKEAKDITLEEGTMWADRLGCKHLMRLLLVLPKMLNHSDLSVQQLENTSAVVTELIDFLVQSREKLFPPSLRLPREEYETTHDFPKSIIARLGDVGNKSNGGSPRSGKEGQSSSIREIVLPSDRNDLTDFVVTVLDQLIVCRASSDDLHRKGRRSFLTLGSPGLVCRHCLGQSGEGKYFYSNLQSLSTASTSIDKHIARCPKTSKDVKEKMAVAKAKHAEQKANAPIGAQTAFFSRLWERFRQLTKTSFGTEADMYFTLGPPTPAMDPDTQMSSSGSSVMEFTNHIEVLTYLQNTASWTANAELVSAMDKYYSCLAWGGTVYATSAMPSNASSEWVLAKLGHETHNHNK